LSFFGGYIGGTQQFAKGNGKESWCSQVKSHKILRKLNLLHCICTAFAVQTSLHLVLLGATANFTAFGAAAPRTSAASRQSSVHLHTQPERQQYNLGKFKKLQVAISS
jgi:hypothetical protein